MRVGSRWRWRRDETFGHGQTAQRGGRRVRGHSERSSWPAMICSIPGYSIRRPMYGGFRSRGSEISVLKNHGARVLFELPCVVRLMICIRSHRCLATLACTTPRSHPVQVITSYHPKCTYCPPSFHLHLVQTPTLLVPLVQHSQPRSIHFPIFILDISCCLHGRRQTIGGGWGVREKEEACERGVYWMGIVRMRVRENGAGLDTMRMRLEELIRRQRALA
jgi:hypothetical protein